MTRPVDFSALPIVYRVKDIKDVGVTAYVKGFADWFFSCSQQYIEVSPRAMHGGEDVEMVGDLKEYSRLSWLVSFVALPILLIAKCAFSRDSRPVHLVTHQTTNGQYMYRDDGSVWYKENGQDNFALIKKVVDGVIYRGMFNRDGDLVFGEMMDTEGNIYKGSFRKVGGRKVFMDRGVKFIGKRVISGEFMENGEPLKARENLSNGRIRAWNEKISHDGQMCTVTVNEQEYAVGIYSYLSKETIKTLQEAPTGEMLPVMDIHNLEGIIIFEKKGGELSRIDTPKYRWLAQIFAPLIKSEKAPDMTAPENILRMAVINHFFNRNIPTFNDPKNPFIRAFDANGWVYLLEHFVGADKLPLGPYHKAQLKEAFPGLPDDVIA